MQRRTTLAALALVTSATMLAACGSSGSSGGGSSAGSGGNTSELSGSSSSSAPRTELASAVSSLGRASTLTTSIKFGASAQAISALAADINATISPAEADALTAASISVEMTAPGGKTLSDLATTGATGGAVNVTLSDAGTDFASFRAVDKTLYIRLDAKDLLAAIGKGHLYRQLNSATAGLPFAQALLHGDWVSIQSSTLKALKTQMGAAAAPSPGLATRKQLFVTLKSVLAKDVTVTRAKSGAADNLTVMANTRTVAADLLASIQSALPGASSASGATRAITGPSRIITLGAQVTGGSLRQLTIDIGQFFKQKISFPVDVDFAKSGPAITAPAGATALTSAQLTLLAAAVPSARLKALLGQLVGGGGLLG